MNNKFNLKMQLVIRTALFNVLTERDIMPLDSHSIHNAVVDAMENHNKAVDTDNHLLEQERSSDMAIYNVGQSIRKIRREKDWSQFELAKKAGVSQSVISRLEQGKTLGTGFNIVQKLQRALKELS